MSYNGAGVSRRAAVEATGKMEMRDFILRIVTPIRSAVVANRDTATRLFSAVLVRRAIVVKREDAPRRHPAGSRPGIGNRGTDPVKVRERIGVRALAAALVMLAFAPAVASAVQTLERIKDRHSITFAYREGALPFSFAGRDKQPRGYSVELCERVARAIQRQLGLAALDIRWIAVDADTRLEAVATGRADAECGTTTIALSRMQRVDFSLPIFVDGGALLVRARSPVQRAADLDGRRVAVIRGTTTERALSAALDLAGARAAIVPVAKPEDGASAVRDGRADAYAGDRLVLTGLVTAEDEGKAATTADDVKLAVLPDDISVEPYAIVVRREDPDFRLAVNRALVEIYKRGEIDAIFRRWLAPLGNPSPLLNAMWYLNALPE